MKKLLFVKFAMLFLSLSVSAHGMDDLGPNKGFIQMPGPFHTEVVQNKDGSYKIYLLDVDFKNPVITNSNVQVTLKDGRSSKLECSGMQDHFHCVGAKKAKNRGQLLVLATRDGVKGSEAVYQLPLKLQK